MNTNGLFVAARFDSWVRGPWRGWARSVVIAVTLLVAACVQSPPVRTSFPPFDFSYLTKLRLNVATIDIDDAWQPPPDPRQIGAYAPVSPVAALRQMAMDRLSAGGTSGRAVFTITDASLLRVGGRINGSFAVRLTVTNADGTRSAFAEARVARSSTLVDDDPATLRDALYTLVKQAMDDMNVEFEYQVRRTLRDWLQTTAPSAPLPPPVQSQDLPPPGAVATPPLPTNTLPGLSPPPSNLAPPSYNAPPPATSFAPTPLAPPPASAPPPYAVPPADDPNFPPPPTMPGASGYPAVPSYPSPGYAPQPGSYGPTPLAPSPYSAAPPPYGSPPGYAPPQTYVPPRGPAQLPDQNDTPD
jgi:hypothetical protein